MPTYATIRWEADYVERPLTAEVGMNWCPNRSEGMAAFGIH